MTNSNGKSTFGERSFVVAVYVAQFFFGGWFFYNGLNYFVEFFPQPPGAAPMSRELISALIHMRLFDVVKAIEALTGAALLANRFVPVAAVCAFPVSYAIAHMFVVTYGDGFHIITAAVIMALNGLILIGHLDKILPMLVFNNGDPSVAGLKSLFQMTTRPGPINDPSAGLQKSHIAHKE